MISTNTRTKYLIITKDQVSQVLIVSSDGPILVFPICRSVPGTELIPFFIDEIFLPLDKGLMKVSPTRNDAIWADDNQHRKK